MAEFKEKLIPIRISYRCDMCKEGEMLPTDAILCSYPPQYPHKCSNSECTHVEIFLVSYPYITYEKV